jgi:hypothetical protein
MTETDPIEWIAAAVGAAAAGAAIGATCIKKFLRTLILRAARNTTPTELLEIVVKIRETKAVGGQGGAEISDEELREIGLAVWEAVKD